MANEKTVLAGKRAMKLCEDLDTIIAGLEALGVPCGNSLKQIREKFVQLSFENERLTSSDLYKTGFKDGYDTAFATGLTTNQTE